MSGIAGDMFVAALLDLGADQDSVISAMEAAAEYVPDCRSIKVTPRPVTRSHIGGLFLDIQIDETFETRSGKTLMEAVEALGKDLRLSKPAKAYANQAIKILVESEATVHRHTPDDVHLHAAGSVDTIIDIIGAAIALDNLKLLDPDNTSHITMPIAVGGGTFTSAHGRLAAPGPAVTGILSKFQLLFKGGPLEQELATPTGVSVIAALNPVSVQVYPLMKPHKVGYGAGTAELPGIPNLLRLVVGTPLVAVLRNFNWKGG